MESLTDRWFLDSLQIGAPELCLPLLVLTPAIDIVIGAREVIVHSKVVLFQTKDGIYE